jgi:hypothetical protein
MPRIFAAIWRAAYRARLKLKVKSKKAFITPYDARGKKTSGSAVG